MQQDLAEAKSSMKREYTSLWSAVQDLNRLDASKEKAIDALLTDKVRSEKKLGRAQRQYQQLQQELTVLDAELLGEARREGLLSSINAPPPLPSQSALTSRPPPPPPPTLLVLLLQLVLVLLVLVLWGQLP